MRWGGGGYKGAEPGQARAEPLKMAEPYLTITADREIGQ